MIEIPAELAAIADGGTGDLDGLPVHRSDGAWTYADPSGASASVRVVDDRFVVTGFSDVYEQGSILPVEPDRATDALLTFARQVRDVPGLAPT